MKYVLLTISFFFGIFSSFGQSYSQIKVSKNSIKINTEKTSFSTPGNRQPVLATYTDRTSFQNDYILQSGNALTSEDFATGPSGINNCGPVISSNGDNCFLPGELEFGFEIRSTTDAGGGDTISIATGNIGNSIHLVGANTFDESTIINFTVDVYAVGMDIWNESDPTTVFRVYDASDNLLEVYTLTNTVSSENFFGIIANEPISRVEIEEANGGGELLGRLEFGEFVLATQGFNENEISVFPNPVTSKVTVSIPSSIQVKKVTLYNILGNDTGLQLKGNTIDTSSLSTGVYLLALETSKGIISRKLIKQ